MSLSMHFSSPSQRPTQLSQMPIFVPRRRITSRVAVLGAQPPCLICGSYWGAQLPFDFQVFGNISLLLLLMIFKHILIFCSNDCKMSCEILFWVPLLQIWRYTTDYKGTKWTGSVTVLQKFRVGFDDIFNKRPHSYSVWKNDFTDIKEELLDSTATLKLLVGGFVKCS